MIYFFYTIRSCSFAPQDIASLKYCVIVVNPEELMCPEGGFQSLFKNKLFTDAILSIIINEVHCLSHWGSFCPEYRCIGSLRHLQCKPCTIMVTSATLTPKTIMDIKTVLALRTKNLFISKGSINHSNISIIVRPMLNT